MKTWMVYLIVFVGVFVGTSIGFDQCAAALTPEEMAEKIHVLRKGFAGVKIEAGERMIYIDPIRIFARVRTARATLVNENETVCRTITRSYRSRRMSRINGIRLSGFFLS